jgi:hypothetical protein
VRSCSTASASATHPWLEPLTSLEETVSDRPLADVYRDAIPGLGAAQRRLERGEGAVGNPDGARRALLVTQRVDGVK